MKQTSEHDPRGLIADALAMDGLSAEEHRAIFFDWAISQERPVEAARALLELHRSPATAGHPVIALLEEAAAGPAKIAGRKGRSRRHSEAGGDLG